MGPDGINLFQSLLFLKTESPNGLNHIPALDSIASLLTTPTDPTPVLDINISNRSVR